MDKLKKWYSEHKDEPLFKAKLLVVFLVILAICVQIYANYRDKEETLQTETSAVEMTAEEPEEDIVLIFWENSRAHFIAFIGVTAALAFVKYKNRRKIKESG